jgi:hypothetical protein
VHAEYGAREASKLERRKVVQSHKRWKKEQCQISRKRLIVNLYDGPEITLIRRTTSEYVPRGFCSGTSPHHSQPAPRISYI